MIELAVALVVILAITAGLLQIASLGRAHTEVMVTARQEAGSLAMGPLPAFDSAEFILDWTPGPDGKRLTKDDVPRNGVTMPFNDVIVDHAAANEDQWEVLNDASRTEVQELRGHPDPASVFGLVKGYESEKLPLLSAVQHLLYRAKYVEVEAEVWMTHTGNIY